MPLVRHVLVYMSLTAAAAAAAVVLPIKGAKVMEGGHGKHIDTKWMGTRTFSIPLAATVIANEL